MPVRFGEFVVDPKRRQLTKAGKAVALSPKAFLLLQILLEQRPNAVAKQQIIDRVWPDTAVEEANVRNLVSEVRRATRKNVIRTVPRFGYAFDENAVDLGSPQPAARLDDAAQSHLLVEGVNVIGRDRQCDVFVDVRGVSRKHAQIRIAEGLAVVEDLGSKNGTWVNGARIGDAVTLHEGDTIQLGLAMLTYRLARAGERTSTVDIG